MSYYEDEPRHPHSKDIALTPENTELHKNLVKGLEANLSADTAHTIEVTETSEGSGLIEVPSERCLARVAFLKIAGLGESVAPFQVAVELKSYLLDADIAKQDPEELARLGYTWPDSVRATLLDKDYSNINQWSSCFQPSADEMFDFTGCKKGFVATETPNVNDIISTAYRIDRGSNSGAGITNDGQDRLASFRIISTILNHGEIDTEATETLLEAVDKTNTLKLVSSDSLAAVNSRNYVDGLIHDAVSTPAIRDMIAWGQYWDERTRPV